MLEKVVKWGFLPAICSPCDAQPGVHPSCWGDWRWRKGRKLLWSCWRNVLKPLRTSGTTVGAGASCLSSLSPPWGWLGHPCTPGYAPAAPTYTPFAWMGEGGCPSPTHRTELFLASTPPQDMPSQQLCSRTWSLGVFREGWLESPGSAPSLPSLAASGALLEKYKYFALRELQRDGGFWK